MAFTGNENQRQAYLKEMGIISYFPRMTLPGAAESPEYELAGMPQPVAVASPPEASAVSKAADPANTAAGLEQTRALLAGLESGPAVTAAVRREQPIPEAEPAAQPVSVSADVSAEIPRFAFCYCPVDPTLAVICETPYQHRGRLQAPVRGLLADILKAIGVPVPERNLTFVPFQWPLHEEPGMESDLFHARQIMQGFLGRQMAGQSVKHLLVFSERWPDYLFAGDYKPDSREALCQHPQFPFSLLVTRGLHAMLADPALKKPAWAQLQQLRKALQAG